MSGGIFNSYNKIRPGAYINIKARKGDRNLFGEIGVAALPLPLKWGEIGAVIETEAGEAEQIFVQKFGYTINDIEMLHIRECLKRAKKLLVYRVAAGTHAELIVDNLTIKAKHVGSFGNSIQIQTSKNVDDPEIVDLKVFVRGIRREVQAGIKNIEDLKASKFVEFQGTGQIPEITVASGGSLLSGSDEQPTVQDYDDAFIAFEKVQFNAIGLVSNDIIIKKMLVNYVTRLCEQEGRYVQGIVADYPADNNYISSIANGVIIRDNGETLTIRKEDAVAWFTGASASAGPYGSLTYSQYERAIRPDVEMQHSEIVERIKKGEILFRSMFDDNGNNNVVVEIDINTLVSFSEEKIEAFQKNRVMRAIMQFANDTYLFWHNSYIGKVSNNVRGRDLLKSDLIKNIRKREGQGVFEDNAFDPLLDISVDKGETKDAVIVSVALTPVDSMEKLYMTVAII